MDSLVSQYVILWVLSFHLNPNFCLPTGNNIKFYVAVYHILFGENNEEHFSGKKIMSVGTAVFSWLKQVVLAYICIFQNSWMCYIRYFFLSLNEKQKLLGSPLISRKSDWSSETWNGMVKLSSIYWQSSRKEWWTTRFYFIRLPCLGSTCVLALRMQCGIPP